MTGQFSRRFSAVMSQFQYIRIPRSDSIFESCLVEPREVGHYSEFADGQVYYDRSLMKYYVPRTCDNGAMDLNDGYENTEKSLGSNCGSYENILYWLRYVYFDPLMNSDVDFVCTRGCIKKLLHTPYMSRKDSEGWLIKACKLDDVIYLKTEDPIEKIKRELYAPNKKKRAISWGYKFEQYLTADTLKGEPNLNSTTYEREEYNIMLKNKIGPYNLLIKSEIDCAKRKPCNGDTTCYIEMKTADDSKSFYDDTFVKQNLLQLWAQSVVVGIVDNIFGFRNQSGIVTRIEEYNTSHIARYAKSKACWDRWVCLNHCLGVLSYLKQNLTENPNVIYSLRCRNRRIVKISQFVVEDEQSRILPSWYAEKLRYFQTR